MIMGTIALRAPGVTRAKSQGRTRSKRGRAFTVNLFPWILIILTLTLGCLLYVQSRAGVIHERYLLEELKREQARGRAENKKLRLAWATLTSPKQIEKVARQRFRLHYPTPKEIVRAP